MVRNVFREGFPGLWLRAMLLQEPRKTALEAALPIRLGIPRIFYASQLFSPINGTAKRLSSAVTAYLSAILDEESLLIVERLVGSVNAGETQYRNRLVADMPASENIDPFSPLFTAQIALVEGAMRVQFPIFESVETEGGALRFVFSRQMTMLWRLDSAVSGDVVGTIHNIPDPVARLTARAALGQYYDIGAYLSIQKAGETMGFDAGYFDTVGIVRDAFRAVDTDAIGLRCSMRGIEFTGRKPGYTYLPKNLVWMVKNREYEAFFNEVAIPKMQIAPKRGFESKELPKSREGRFFEAERLGEGQAEGFVEVAKQVFEEWVDEKAVDEVFQHFREYWTTENRSKKKNWKLAWRNWLKKRDIGYSPIFVPLKRALEVAMIAGVDRGTAVVEFANFKRFYLSRGEVRKKWLPAWEAWLEKAKERARKEALEGRGLERQFYIARLVSAEIEEILYQAGTTPAEVISGERSFRDIGWRSIPVPPTGKESVTLFYWRDDKAQADAMGKYMETSAAQLASKVV